MNNIFAAIAQIDFPGWLWIFAIALAIHELEEWNILRWYQRNYVDLPAATNRTVRVWIVFFSLVCLVWCAVATLPGNPAFAAYLFLPTVAVAMQNALQHVYWLFYFIGQRCRTRRAGWSGYSQLSYYGWGQSG